MRRVERTFCATIIWGPEYGRKVLKMWSWVLFVRPSKSRFIPRRRRPQELVFRACWFDADGFLVGEGWCKVNTATPAVTRKTTRYL